MNTHVSSRLRPGRFQRGRCALRGRPRGSPSPLRLAASRTRAARSEKPRTAGSSAHSRSASGGSGRGTHCPSRDCRPVRTAPRGVARTPATRSAPGGSRAAELHYCSARPASRIPPASPGTHLWLPRRFPRPLPRSRTPLCAVRIATNRSACEAFPPFLHALQVGRAGPRLAALPRRSPSEGQSPARPRLVRRPRPGRAPRPGRSVAPRRASLLMVPVSRGRFDIAGDGGRRFTAAVPAEGLPQIHHNRPTCLLCAHKDAFAGDRHRLPPRPTEAGIKAPVLRIRKAVTSGASVAAKIAPPEPSAADRTGRGRTVRPPLPKPCASLPLARRRKSKPLVNWLGPSNSIVPSPRASSELSSGNSPRRRSRRIASEAVRSKRVSSRPLAVTRMT